MRSFTESRKVLASAAVGAGVARPQLADSTTAARTANREVLRVIGRR
jgi:hypothetical protein